MFTKDSTLPILIFLAFTGFTLGLSFWLGRKAKSSAGYFAAHGSVGWFVNGIAFAGDYLSAASFLGICGMIAFYGYDGFLYSIGFLAGWVVALFVIAEPIKKLGKFTFADALDAKYGSSGIKLAAAISTLVVSLFYLIPQMVGAGALLKALLGLPPHVWNGIDLNHAVGVVVVGTVVIVIVTTAGMVSTTWVQFIKGSLLVFFCAILVVMILNRGIATNFSSRQLAGSPTDYAGGFDTHSDLDNFVPPNTRGGLVESIDRKTSTQTGPLGPVGYLSAMETTRVVSLSKFHDTKWYLADWHDFDLLPGGSPTFAGIRSPHVTDRLNFVSLMLALFAGTASLPHILIRYYTVKDAAAARKSTVVGIGAIGFFYILTLYIGLGAMVSGNLDPADSNMAAPLLAKTFGNWMFAIISAIAFTTVLGTVSGLILAAAGAVAHDLRGLLLSRRVNVAAALRSTDDTRGSVNDRSAATSALDYQARRPPKALTDDQKQVRIAKIASVVVGLLAIVLGIVFRSFNVAMLVGWAFAVAASANLPAIVMILFWRGTTRQGIVASISVGLATSLIWLLLSTDAFKNLYHSTHAGYVPFSQPGLVTIPLSFVVLVIVSLLTRRESRRGFEVE